jgi:pseudaminic acid synthase
MGAIVPIVSVCFGAKIIEKHFILDRSIGGPDASFSMNESEFKEMVIAVRQAESAIGIQSYELTEKQKAGKVFSRSLYIAKDLKKGDILDEATIRSVRPGHSLHPKHLPELLGKKALRDFTIGDRIKKEDFE